MHYTKDARKFAEGVTAAGEFASSPHQAIGSTTRICPSHSPLQRSRSTLEEYRNRTLLQCTIRVQPMYKGRAGIECLCVILLCNTDPCVCVTSGTIDSHPTLLSSFASTLHTIFIYFGYLSLPSNHHTKSSWQQNRANSTLPKPTSSSP